MSKSSLRRLFLPHKVQLPPRTDGWYGRASLAKGEQPPLDDTTINQFRINISDEELDDLKKRLKSPRYFEAIEGTNFLYGFSAETLTQVVDYWLNKYDWRRWEQELNKYDQFKTQIEGLDVHYVHIRPKNPDGVVIPLLAIHGWPGSFFEYYKTIPILTDSSLEGLSFEVVIPSIPGYGFSEAPHKEGFSFISAARVFVKLMKRLGLNRFLVHGGDWGSMISKTIALMYPENVRGIHTTFYTSSQPQGADNLKYLMAKYLPIIMFNNRESQRTMFNDLLHYKSKWFYESGYFHLQSTKPETIGPALTDSPVGLAAYLLEKFSAWTDPTNVFKPDGGLTEKFTMDELLTNVMIYWFSKNITSSMRFYKENGCPIIGVYNKYRIGAAKVSPTVPAGYAVFPNEMVRVPEFIVRMAFENLVHYTELPSGGHFGAFEEPKLLAEDLRKFAFTVVTKG